MWKICEECLIFTLCIHYYISEKIHSSFKNEDDDDGKRIVYNTVGPTVCMGDHKVKTGKLLFR